MQKRKSENLNRIKTGAIVIAIVVLAISIAFIFKFSAEKAQAAPDSTLYFYPATDSVAAGQDFTLDAMINPGTNQVTGVSMGVTFDPAVFRLDSVSVAGSPFSVELPGSAIDNTNGTATKDVAVPPGTPTVPVTTVAKVATFSFHALTAAAGSPIAFTGASYAVATGEASDVLTDRTPSLVTVTGGVTYSNADFANLVADWLQTKVSPADVNSDGTVNSRDLGIMMSNWE